MCRERGLRKEWLYPDVPFIAEIWRFVLACSQTQVYAWCALSSCVNFSVTCTDLIKTGKLTTKRTRSSHDTDSQDIPAVSFKTDTAQGFGVFSQHEDILHEDQAGLEDDLCLVVRPWQMRRGCDPSFGPIVFWSGEEFVQTGCVTATTPCRVEATIWPHQQRGYWQGACAVVPRSVSTRQASTAGLIPSHLCHSCLRHSQKKTKTNSNNNKTDRQEYVFPRCMKGK